MKKVLVAIAMLLCLIGCESKVEKDVTSGNVRMVMIPNGRRSEDLNLINKVIEEGWTLVNVSDSARFYYFVKKEDPCVITVTTPESSQ